MLISREPPDIPLAILPGTERIQAQSIQLVLRSLGDYTRSFGAAISLRNFCAVRRAVKHPFLSDWAAMAARDGATILSHFGEALEDLRELKRAPGLRRLVDLSKCDSARQSFASAFPGFDGAGQPPGLHDLRRGRAFQASDVLETETIIIRHGGKSVGYQFSEASLSALIEIKNTVYEAYSSSSPPKAGLKD